MKNFLGFTVSALLLSFISSYTTSLSAQSKVQNNGQVACSAGDCTSEPEVITITLAPSCGHTDDTKLTLTQIVRCQKDFMGLNEHPGASIKPVKRPKTQEAKASPVSSPFAMGRPGNQENAHAHSMVIFNATPSWLQ